MVLLRIPTDTVAGYYLTRKESVHDESSTGFVGILLSLGCLVLVGCKGKRAPKKEEPEPTETDKKPDLLTSIVDGRNQQASSNNLKQLIFAFQNYSDACNSLPQNIVDPNGKPLLSWRVHLLPFIEQQELYHEFKLDEPWDSKNNIKLLEKIPKTFESPRAMFAKKGYTVYQGFAGPGALFQGGRVSLQESVQDGRSNTIAIVEASEAVPWTKPVDLPFDENKAVPNFAKAYDNKALVAMADDFPSITWI